MSRWRPEIAQRLLLVPIATHSEIIGELKQKSGATLKNTYIWNGKELKPKSGAALKNTWGKVHAGMISYLCELYREGNREPFESFLKGNLELCLESYFGQIDVAVPRYCWVRQAT